MQGNIKRHIENKQRFLFIQTSLKGTNLSGRKKRQRCLHDEHLDHKEIDFPTSSSEDQSLSMTRTF